MGIEEVVDFYKVTVIDVIVKAAKGLLEYSKAPWFYRTLMTYPRVVQQGYTDFKKLQAALQNITWLTEEDIRQELYLIIWKEKVYFPLVKNKSGNYYLPGLTTLRSILARRIRNYLLTHIKEQTKDYYLLELIEKERLLLRGNRDKAREALFNPTDDQLIEINNIANSEDFYKAYKGAMR